MTYREPSRSVCDVDDYEIQLADGYVLHVNWWAYRKLFVRWSLELCQDQPREPIVRIDTSDGTIHRHMLAAGQDERLEQEVIPDRDGWRFVHDAYTRYYDVMMAHWAEWVRRWRT